MMELIIPVAVVSSVIAVMTGLLYLSRSKVIKVKWWFYVLSLLLLTSAFPVTITMIMFFVFIFGGLAIHPDLTDVWLRWGYVSLLLLGVWFLVAWKSGGLKVIHAACIRKTRSLHVLLALPIILAGSLDIYFFPVLADIYYEEFDTSVVYEHTYPGTGINYIVLKHTAAHGGMYDTDIYESVGLGLYVWLLDVSALYGPYQFVWSNDGRRFVFYELDSTGRYPPHPVGGYDYTTGKPFYPAGKNDSSADGKERQRAERFLKQ